MQSHDLTIDDFPASTRNHAWQQKLAVLSLQALGSDLCATGGMISCKRSSTGACLGFISGSAQSLTRLQPEGMEPPLLILLCLKGRGRITTLRKGLEIAERDLCVLDICVDWRIDWRSDFDAVVLAVPRATVESRLGRSRTDFPVTLGGALAGSAAKPVLQMLAVNLDALEQADLSAGEIAVTELVVSALLSEAKETHGTMTQVQSAHFRRITAAIDGRLGQPDLSPTDIARQEGMSARYLQRLFGRRNETFSDYLRQQRLERSRTDLADPNHAHESVATIARRWGFRDQAHFSRIFSAAFGVAPREARKGSPVLREQHALRGKPARGLGARSIQARAPVARVCDTHLADAGWANSALLAGSSGKSKAKGERPSRHHLAANAGTVHWGYLSRAIPPVLRVSPESVVTIETLTQHAADDWDRMVAGDPGAESVFEWTRAGKAVDRRGAGPMNASVFGRGAGEGFGVHICTGPVYVRGAEPGDILEVEFLDIRPRPSANPAHAGKAFASNASAWWGFQYNDLLDRALKREAITIYEIDLLDQTHARPVYNYIWTPQTDPFGIVHATMDYPGVPVDHASIRKVRRVLEGIRIPARPHFGFVAVAPRESEIVDSIPPGYFGGNIDNWRAGKGAKLYLPVAVEGALLSIGDGHFAQGDGEVNGTGLECSLTADIRIGLHKPNAVPRFLFGLHAPLIETPTQWVIQGFSFQNYLRELGREAQSAVYSRSTIDLALRNAFRQTRRFLMDVYDLGEDEALSLMSLAVDFGVTQVADGNLGVHAIIDKAIFAERAASPAQR